jgi:hypothetical protein
MRKTFSSILLAATLILSMALAAPVAGDSNCDPPRNADGINRQGGWTEYGTGTNKITAIGGTLEYLSAHADLNQGATGTFLRIAVSGQTYNFVSIGFKRTWPGYGTVFVELGSLFGVTQWNYNNMGSNFAAPAPDTSVDFQIVKQGNGQWKFYRDSINILTLSDPGWPTSYATHGQFLNESHSATNQWWGGKWDYNDINLMRYGINMSSYYTFGSSPLTLELFPHKSPSGSWLSDYAIQRTVPGYQGWPEMDTWDWACF